MRPSLFPTGLLASMVAFVATSASAQVATAVAAAPKAIQTLGCYSKSYPLQLQGSYTFQTSGYCQQQCASLNKPVMATTQGSTCYCGDYLPPASELASNSSCNMPCNGYGQDNCGGLGFWTFYLTGLDVVVATATGSGPSATATSTGVSGGSSSKTSSPSVVTQPGQTVVATVTASSTAGSNSSAGGGSKVGVAVGVVVALLAVAGIIAGIVLFLRQRRKRALEEEHRRNAAVSQILASAKEKKPTPDQRLDPSVFAHRRESIGSIADERDFSRRILQVRNPDSQRNSGLSGMGV